MSFKDDTQKTSNLMSENDLQTMYTRQRGQIEDLLINYNEFIQDFDTAAKKECQINNLLAKMPATGTVEIGDIKRQMEKEKNKFSIKKKTITSFAEKIKALFKIDRHYFSFFRIPELILKLKMSKKDFQFITKHLLFPIQKTYLICKSRIMQEVPIEKLSITEEDRVPIELINDMVSQLEKKQEAKENIWYNIVDKAKAEVDKKIRNSGASSEDMKQKIRSNGFITSLNLQLEQNHTLPIENEFKNNLIHSTFVQIVEEKDNLDESLTSTKTNAVEVQPRKFKTLNALEELFKACLNFEISNDEREKMKDLKQSFNIDLKAMTAYEMAVFTGKGPPKDQDHGATQANKLQGALKSTGTFGAKESGGKSVTYDTVSEIQREVERMREEEEALLNRNPLQKFYKDVKTHKQYDPQEKFGVLGQKAHEHVYSDKFTTSYPVELPIDYYKNYMKDAIGEGEDTEWYLRPHHVETLTHHEKSMKDDVTNTRYVSHYNADLEKPKKQSHFVSALSHIEGMLEELKSRQRGMAALEGVDLEGKLEELRPQLEKQAKENHDRFISYKAADMPPKEMLIQAYEGVLTHKRVDENNVLNRQRRKKHEKNRPPEAKWYELKDKRFVNEMYRNRVQNKPSGENSEFLKNLLDTNLY